MFDGGDAAVERLLEWKVLKELRCEARGIVKEQEIASD